MAHLDIHEDLHTCSQQFHHAAKSVRKDFSKNPFRTQPLRAPQPVYIAGCYFTHLAAQIVQKLIAALAKKAACSCGSLRVG
jgi:hypothetical protein